MEIIFLPGNWLLSLFGAFSLWVISACMIALLIYTFKNFAWPIIKIEEPTWQKCLEATSGFKVYRLLFMFTVILYLIAALGTAGPRIAISNTTETSSKYLETLKDKQPIELEQTEFIKKGAIKEYHDKFSDYAKEQSEDYKDKEWKK